jgi:hypothetical protein
MPGTRSSNVIEHTPLDCTNKKQRGEEVEIDRVRGGEEVTPRTL